MQDAPRNAWLAQLFAWYLRYFPIKKWKKAISSRVGPHLVSVPLKSAYGFYVYTRFHDRTNRKAFQGNLGILPAFVRAVPRGACFIDIGANLGVIAIMAARQVGQEGRVLAFEPVAGTHRELRRNVALNALGNIETFQLAIAARSDVVQMTEPDPMHSGAAHVASKGEGTVSAVPLADVPEVIAAAAARPVYVKVDTEGYELEVLKGMRALLEGRRVVSLVIEIDHGHLSRFGASAGAIYAELAHLGYRPRLHPTPVAGHYDEIFDCTDGAANASSGNISPR
jgi:FkbM family methyltransferase